MATKTKKTGATVTAIGGTAAVAAKVQEASHVTALVEKKPIKPIKPGPYMDKVGGTVEYVLPSGTKIEATVSDTGHACCPTCTKRLASGVADGAKVESVKKREDNRFASMASEFARVRGIIAKERQRTGLPALTSEEMMEALMKQMNAEPEEEAKSA